MEFEIRSQVVAHFDFIPSHKFKSLGFKKSDCILVILLFMQI